MKSRVRVWLAVAAKLTVTVGLLAWLLSRIDWRSTSGLISDLSLPPLLLCVVLLLLLTLPVARRWELVVSAMGTTIGFMHSLRMLLMTVLVNQCIPSNLGGDAYRVVATTQAGMQWTRATLAAIVDRLIALVALAIVALAGVLAVLDQAELANERIIVVIGTLLIVLGTLALWLFFRSQLADKLSNGFELLRRLIAALSELLNHPVKSLYLLGLSLFVQIVTIGVMGYVARQLGIETPILPLLGICALGLLIARLPISYGGWGVREGTLVLGLVPFGVSPEAALAASITYGLTELCAAAIGGIIWAAMSLSPEYKRENKRHAQ